ncbi:type II secretion system protein [Tepidibacter thalassicus]|uniref:Type IV pilin N-term methylation site GFxxxE n=1 Tax=Tepidibacter thalassicus DSM 15285 TaxID=1123350 RepID=A0A1M5T6H8_9FIRM|nr:type II secretion system protein [Tepidibacter thalassicus]SHH46351.1 Type IV pilin N-term methylation site GFxxxE [Tepidibacter thalassicus DSM 15285]
MLRAIQKRLKNKKGFTLVELIIVIAVLGILVGIAVPKFSGIQENARKKTDITNAKMISDAISVLLAEGKIDAPSSSITFEVVSKKQSAPQNGSLSAEQQIQNALIDYLSDIPKIKSNGNSHKDDSFYVTIEEGAKSVKVLDAENKGIEIYPQTDDKYE